MVCLVGYALSHRSRLLHDQNHLESESDSTLVATGLNARRTLPIGAIRAETTQSPWLWFKAPIIEMGRSLAVSMVDAFERTNLWAVWDEKVLPLV